MTDNPFGPPPPVEPTQPLVIEFGPETIAAMRALDRMIWPPGTKGSLDPAPVEVGAEGRPLDPTKPLIGQCSNCLHRCRVDWLSSTWFPPAGHRIRGDGSIECPDERIIQTSLTRLAEYVGDVMREHGLIELSDGAGGVVAAVKASIQNWEG